MSEQFDWLIDLARRAGEEILSVYATDFKVTSKDDDSPLTRADMAANNVIVAGLQKHDPKTPILSEEGGLPEFDVRGQWSRYYLVDPLDGTKEFVNRNGEFTVNIALIENHRSVLGVVHVPVTGITYIGGSDLPAQRIEANGERRPIRVSAQSHAPLRVVGSRSHRGSSLDAWLAKAPAHDMLAMGSSLKFCAIAEGQADVYPRLGPTSEWDTGAAQAVVEAAGGKVVTLDGAPLAYNTKADILNPHFFVIGANDQNWLALL